MRILATLLIVGITLYALPTEAGTAEARETARQNNCVPKKIQIYQQKLGNNPPTIYRVDCIEPKTVGENIIKTPPAILVECQTNLCSMLRPINDQPQ